VRNGRQEELNGNLSLRRRKRPVALNGKRGELNLNLSPKRRKRPVEPNGKLTLNPYLTKKSRR
jgi:hypothetical protein|tara:strand:- start:14192 stop:14380 length:189 start_codon:yes stop_codon:yes gene_type:complete